MSYTKTRDNKQTSHYQENPHRKCTNLKARDSPETALQTQSHSEVATSGKGRYRWQRIPTDKNPPHFILWHL